MSRPLARRGGRTPLTGLVALVLPSLLAAQEPPDTVPVAADTVRAESADSAAAQPPSEASGDSLVAIPPDSLYRVLPRMTQGAPARPESGVTVWNRQDLLANRALTLTELLAQEPDLLPLRFGDMGAPQAVVGAGLVGGRVRVFSDGYELLPLSGANPALERISIGGLERVRVERGGGELRIHLTSLEPFDSRPMSRVEAGTGDLDTNIFRGTFIHPRALGGSLGVTLERLDTQGPGGDEPGARQGVMLRYALHGGDDWSLSMDWRRGGAEIALDTARIPPSATRTDWTLRARSRLSDAVTGELFAGGASLSAEDDGRTPLDLDRSQYGVRLSFDTHRPPDPPRFRRVETVPDSLVIDAAVRDSLAQAAGDSAATPDAGTDETGVGVGTRLWATASGRLLGGAELPASRLDAAAGADLPGVGGFAGEVRRDAWTSESASSVGFRAWTAPLLGVSLFGGYDSGRSGARVFAPRDTVIPPPEDGGDGGDGGDDGGSGDGGGGESDGGSGQPDPEPTLPDVRFSDRTAVRLGARVRLGPLDLTGAWHRVEIDSLIPLYDLAGRDAVVVPRGDAATALELSGRLRLPLLAGLSLVGSLMEWQEEAAWRPARRYTGGLDFANRYYDGQLEIRAHVQVDGRDPMLVPFIDPDAPTEDPGDGTGEPIPLDPTYQRVPFHQSWNAWLHIRIQTVRIFVRWENLFLRPANQDYPGRILPQTRAVYGVRWTFWN